MSNGNEGKERILLAVVLYLEKVTDKAISVSLGMSSSHVMHNTTTLK